MARAQAQQSTTANKIYSKINTMYKSLSRQVQILADPNIKNQEAKPDLSGTMKQFKLFKSLVTRMKGASDDSGTLEDLMLYKECHEKFTHVTHLLAQVDEGSFKLDPHMDMDRESTNSCVGGSNINFYNDEDEAQELILEEDRLTVRSSKQKNKEEFRDDETLESFGKYQKLRKSKYAGGRERGYFYPFSSDTV